MKTSELTGAALDWAVAKCEGVAVEFYAGNFWADPHNIGRKWQWKPHADWSQGGPIIEREQIETICNGMQPDGLQWVARTQAEKWTYDPLESGPTPLIAAMRCYVASKLGEEVEVPQELI